MVELDMFKLFVHIIIQSGPKISRNSSELGSNCQILKNPAKVIFEYGYPDPYIFVNALFYSI